MTFEIDDLNFHLKAMNSPDYQPVEKPLVESKKTIEELQEKITLTNKQLITEREHKEQILNERDGNVHHLNTITIYCCTYRNN